MKRGILACLFAATLAGCSYEATIASLKQDAAAMEAWVANFVAQVKAKAPVVEADIQQGVQLSCNLVSLGQASLTTFQGNVSGISDRTQGYLTQASAYLNKGAAACASYNATIASSATPSQGINMTLAAWNAYVAAKGQMSAAQALLAPRART